MATSPITKPAIPKGIAQNIPNGTRRLINKKLSRKVVFTGKNVKKKTMIARVNTKRPIAKLTTESMFLFRGGFFVQMKCPYELPDGSKKVMQFMQFGLRLSASI